MKRIITLLLTLIVCMTSVISGGTPMSKVKAEETSKAVAYPIFVNGNDKDSHTYILIGYAIKKNASTCYLYPASGDDFNLYNISNISDKNTDEHEKYIDYTFSKKVYTNDDHNRFTTNKYKVTVVKDWSCLEEYKINEYLRQVSISACTDNTVLSGLRNNITDTEHKTYDIVTTEQQVLHIVGYEGRYDGRYENSTVFKSTASFGKLTLGSPEYPIEAVSSGFFGNICAETELYLADNAIIGERAFYSNSCAATTRSINIYNFSNISKINTGAFSNRKVNIIDKTVSNNSNYMTIESNMLMPNALENTTLSVNYREVNSNDNIFYFFVKNESGIGIYDPKSTDYYGTNIVVRGNDIVVSVFDRAGKKTTTKTTFTDITIQLPTVNVEEGEVFEGYKALSRYDVDLKQGMLQNGYSANILELSDTILHIDSNLPNSINVREKWKDIDYEYSFHNKYKTYKDKQLKIGDTFKFPEAERDGYVFKGWKEDIEEVPAEDVSGDVSGDTAETTTEETTETTEEVSGEVSGDASGDATKEEVPKEPVYYQAGEEYTVDTIGDKSFTAIFELDVENVLYKEATVVRQAEFTEELYKDLDISKKNKEIVDSLIVDSLVEGNVDMNTLITKIDENELISQYNKDKIVKEIRAKYETAKAAERVNVAKEEAEAAAAKKKAKEEAEAAAKKAEEANKKKDKTVTSSTSKKAINALKLKNLKSKKMKISFSKVEGVSKYVIQVSTSKKFTKKTTKTYSSKKSSYTVKKLKKSKKYYVRVYATIDGERVYSSVKSIKIKK